MPILQFFVNLYTHRTTSTKLKANKVPKGVIAITLLRRTQTLLSAQTHQALLSHTIQQFHRSRCCCLKIPRRHRNQQNRSQSQNEN